VGPLPRALLERVVDLVPTPIALVEPETGRILFANRAADELAGGAMGRPAAVGEYDAHFRVMDVTGRRLDAADLPAARLARGERLSGLQVDWDNGGRTTTVLVSGELVAVDDGTVGVLAFEDVTAVRAAERLRDESVALLDTLFASASVGFALLDRDLRFARVNEALAQINGVPPEAHVGRTVADVLPDLDPAAMERMREVLRTGEPVPQIEVRGETPAEPGRERVWLESWYPARHPATGEVLGLGAVVTEITDRVELLRAERRARRRAERAEQRAAFLVRAGDALTSSLDLEETLRQVARVAVPSKADWCAVDLVGRDGALHRVALEHVDPSRRERGRELERRWPVEQGGGRSGAAAVVRTGQPLLFEEVTDELLREAARDEEHLAALRELGLSSAMVVPMRVRGRTLGALSFVLADRGQRYGREDLDLALEVARRAATAIDNARLYEERAHIARTLQRSLLPATLPEVPGFEVAARYRAAGEGYEVGGDFYDVFESGPGAWSIVIGDVCGKGPEAAALTSLARYTVRAAALSHGLPSQVLAMTDAAIRRERTDGRFMSVVHGALALDGPRASIALANAGHPPVLHRSAAGEVRLVNGPGAILGTGLAPELADVEVALEGGDVLVAYTDGVLDAAAPLHDRAPEELAAFLATLPAPSADAVADAVERWALDVAGGEARDDLALLVLRRR